MEIDLKQLKSLWGTIGKVAARVLSTRNAWCDVFNHHQVYGMAGRPYLYEETRKLALMWRLLALSGPNYTVVADHYFCSYFMIAFLLTYSEMSVLFHGRNMPIRKWHVESNHWTRSKFIPNGIDHPTYMIRWKSPRLCGSKCYSDQDLAGE